MFKTLGRFSTQYPWLICAAWLLLGAAVAFVAPAAGHGVQDDDIRFLPARCPSVRGYQLLEQAFPQDVFASRVLFAVERADAPLTDADLTLVDGMADDLDRLKRDEPALQISRVVTPPRAFIGKRLLSDDGRCTLLQISLATPYMAVQTANAVDRAEQVVRKRLAEAGPDAPELYVTGHAGIGRDLIRASAHGLDSTTLATVILVVVILLIVYRAPLLALVPLVTIAVSVWVALKSCCPVYADPRLLPRQHQPDLRRGHAVRGGHRLLPVPHQPLPRSSGDGPAAGRRPGAKRRPRWAAPWRPAPAP